MRDKFSWRLQPSDKDFEELWENSVFVFDANVLLNLYRVSPSTAEDWLSILERLKDRIWLPFQAASEFFDHRESVIEAESASFEKAVSALTTWAKDQRQLNRLKGQLKESGRIIGAEILPLLENLNSYFLALDEVEKLVKLKIEEMAKAHQSSSTNDDSILDKITTLFEGRVGEPYDLTSEQKHFSEAEKRFKAEQPPGFEDGKDKEGNRKYGDYILWRQLLDFACSADKNVIFITSERKRDWWAIKNGEIKYPHVQLRREFREVTNKKFWMYRTEVFMEQARERLSITIKESSIEEALAVSVDSLQTVNEPLINVTLGPVSNARTSYDFVVNAESEFLRSELIQEAERLRDLIDASSVDSFTKEKLTFGLRNGQAYRDLREQLNYLKSLRNKIEHDIIKHNNTPSQDDILRKRFISDLKNELNLVRKMKKDVELASFAFPPERVSSLRIDETLRNLNESENSLLNRITTEEQVLYESQLTKVK